MSLHPSLKQSSNDSSRTVMKKEERIKKLMKEGKWSENGSVFGLPKIKIVRMKVVKKEKKQEAQEKEGSQSKQASKK